MRLEIDGREVDAAPGDSILDAARALGVSIPTLCFDARLPPEGGCRVCQVEVEGEPEPLAACCARVREGMRVRTASPRLDALRQDLLALIAGQAGAPPRASADGTPFERLLARYRVVPPSAAHAPAQPPLEIHPLLRFAAERCILCRRCINVCDDLQGQFVYAVEGRGGTARLAAGDGAGKTDCVACGACVDACPTGALLDIDRLDAARAERRTPSVCGYCGVGCAVEIESAGERVLRIGGVADSPVNHGQLCAKGRFAHAHRRAPDRLTRPLRRGPDGELHAVPWSEALAFAAARLRDTRDRHGPRALAALCSSRSTNEAAYLLQRLFRSALASNNVDCCARVCHASTAQALRSVTGTGAASASYADIERARCIVIAGANPTEAHPVIGARLKQAVRRGASLVVIDPRATELAGYADVHLAPRPGTNVALWNALARILVDEGLIDVAYLQQRCEGYEALRSFLATSSPEAAGVRTGVPVEAIRAAALRIGRDAPALFVSGLGLSEQTQGTDAVRALCNVALLTGSIGRPGAGMLPLRGQNNVQGNADMGAMPDLVTGYQALDAPDVRARLEQVWGAAPPLEPGRTLPELLDSAAAGELRALWICGEDIAQSDPNETHVRAALTRLEFLVVQEMFPTETTGYAHLVLPAAGALEQDGTFTNAERRIQRVRAAVAPPGEARPDWEVIRDLGLALGLRWRFEAPSQVMDEIARVAPHLFGGVSYARLEPHGLQWPCPSPEHPGTPNVHADRFLRGRALLSCVSEREGPEERVPGYPYLLITGRILEHYNVGSMTRRSPLEALAPDDRLEIHPDDAASERISDGARVAIESRWGRANARALVTPRVARGQLFLSFHHPETHTNRVTGPSLDPESHCPDYKVTAVRLARA